MSDQRLRWSGAALLSVLCVATLTLAATGKLTLYIHPRYTVLSVVMASLGLVLALAGLAVVRAPAPAHGAHEHHDHDDHHGHDVHEHHTASRSFSDRFGGLGRAGVVALVAVGLLVVPPATLSASLRSDRGLVTTGRALGDAPTEQLVGADTSTYTVRDWAALVQQGPDAVAGQPVVVTGYVLDRGEADVFWVARLTVSCCAVDAQPVGVAVSKPGWRQQLKPDSWVTVRGSFVDAADQPSAAQHPAVIEPTAVTTVPEPVEPYVF